MNELLGLNVAFNFRGKCRYCGVPLMLTKSDGTSPYSNNSLHIENKELDHIPYRYAF